MKIVADASLILAVVMDDEDAGEYAEEIHQLLGVYGFEVPLHFYFEVANALLTAVRNKRTDQAGVRRASEIIRGLRPRPTFEDTAPYLFGVVSVYAQKHQLTIYDAAYLELAIRVGAKLATLDGKLRKAAIKEGVFLGSA